MTGFFKLLIYFLIFYIIYLVVRYLKMLRMTREASRKRNTIFSNTKKEQNKYQDIEDAKYIEITEDPKKKTGK